MKIKTSDAPDATRMDLSPTRGTREADSSAASNSVTSNRTSSADSIAISGTSSLVQQAMGSGSAARAARVLELKQQFQSGQYQADPIAVSRALIAAHLAGE